MTKTHWPTPREKNISTQNRLANEGLAINYRGYRPKAGTNPTELKYAHGCKFFKQYSYQWRQGQTKWNPEIPKV